MRTVDIKPAPLAACKSSFDNDNNINHIYYSNTPSTISLSNPRGTRNNSHKMHFFKTFLPAALLATTVVAAPSPEPEPKLRGKKVQGPATIKFVWCRYNNHQYTGWESCQATTYYTSPKSAGDKMVQSSRKSVIHPLYNWFRFLDIENKKERITSNWDLDNTVTFSYKPKKAWTSRKFITGAPDNVINTGPELMDACRKTLKDNGVKDAKIKELVGSLNLQESRVFEYKNLPDVFDDKTKF